MNVLLLQLDGKLPNLALMRLAAYHRGAGDVVALRRAANSRSLQPRFEDPSWDRVYGSLIFQSAGVAAFHKQMPIKGRVSGDVSQFPPDLQVREFPMGSRGSGSV